MRKLAVALAVASTLAISTTAVVLAWPQRGKQTTAVQFLTGVIRLVAANRYAEAWQSLAPAAGNNQGRK